MTRQDNSFRNILKGNSIFGGVKVLQILLNLVRGKFVAAILGPAGMGVNALFSSAFQTISTWSTLGLQTAIVKEVASKKEQKESLQEAVGVVRRLVTVIGLVGAAVCFLFAGPLSRLTFGSDSFAWGFRLLAVGVYFEVAGTSLLSVLQGLHLVKAISIASLAGGVTSLIVGVPLIYFFSTDGIPPMIVAMSVTTYIFYCRAVNKSVVSRGVRLSWSRHRPFIIHLFSLGLLLVVGDIFFTSVNYATYLIIRVWGDTATVGLFQGANSLSVQYAGILLTTMTMDYFPRLSSVSNDHEEMDLLIGRQIEIVGIVATPMLCLLILFAPLIVNILLTSKFIASVPLMRLLALGLLIKALNYPLGFITFAKDNKRVYFWMEAVGANVLTLGLNVGCYLMWGLNGLGYALIADNVVCLIVYALVNHRLYGLRLNKTATRAIIYSILAGASVLCASMIESQSEVVSYVLMGLITASTIVIGLQIMRRRLRRE
ncbi:MAG: oligosaccharide flippase family protein [Muribaculaceae bacterium]|nr:oligosaccharide flippase family protein [Muribaculaceae bacterium]